MEKMLKLMPTISPSNVRRIAVLLTCVPSNISTSQKTVQIDLPQIQTASKDNIKKSLNLFISKEGEYYIDAKKMDIEKIADKLETVSLFNKNMVVFFYGDENTPYHYIDRVIKLLKQAGLRNCIFVTKKEEDG